jgi:hypothetical protein
LQWHLNAKNAQEPGSAKPVGVQEKSKAQGSAALTEQSETASFVTDRGYAQFVGVPAPSDNDAVSSALDERSELR